MKANMAPALAGDAALRTTIHQTRVEARRKRVRRTPRTATLVAWSYAVISAYPLLWLVIQTFRTDAEILASPWGFPTRPSMDAYIRAFDTTPLPQYFLNSFTITLAVVLLSIVCCALAGYAFSIQRFPGSGRLFTIFIGVLLIPTPLLLLPTFLVSRDLGILNSYLGLIAPYAAGTLPVGVYLMKTSFDAMPTSLIEAAELDRANSLQVFWHVMLPLALPVCATVGILAFNGAWNEYVYAAVAMQDPALYTLPVGVADLGAKKATYGYGPVFAAMVIAALPVYIAFFFAQKSFTAAITGGIKA